MENNKIILSVCILATLLSSCSFYNPISTNVPVYESVGEVNVGVNIGTSADIQVSTNPINHLSIIGTASTSGSISNEIGREINVPDSLRYTYNRNQFELGIGYYYSLTDKIQHDFHVGYGSGSAAKRDDIFSTDDNYAYRADFTNFFIQSSIVLNLDEDVKGFISSKFNYLTISNYEESYDRFSQGLFGERLIFNEESFWLSQLGIGLIADLGPLQIVAQGQLNFRFTNELFVEERPLGLYAGVNFNISEIIKRTKEKDYNGKDYLLD